MQRHRFYFASIKCFISRAAGRSDIYPGVSKLSKMENLTVIFNGAAWKVSKYRVFPGPYFLAFGLNTERYKSVQIRSFFWSVFSDIRIEYSKISRISPYSVQMRENVDQEKTPDLDTFHAARLLAISYYCKFLNLRCLRESCTAQKMKFSIKQFSVTATKSAGDCGFHHIYWWNP